MPKWPFILSTLVLTSCGGFKLWNSNTAPIKQREIASMSVQNMVQEEAHSFANEVDEKLLSLHSYYLIAQANLALFDESIEGKGLEELYKAGPYLKLTAVRTQTDEIEDELRSLRKFLKEKNDPRLKVLEERITKFSRTSSVHALSMENIASSIALSLGSSALPTQAMIHKELQTEEKRREFQVYEQNIEHLSHLMELKIRSSLKKFAPKEGISGQEFPTKVWAMTFDDGPDKKVSPLMVKQLKERKLKATFFQLASKVEADPKTAGFIRDAGMEIASHSYSHKLLTTVGNLTLNKEITLATESMEKHLKVDIKFFRLPYGIGASTPNIRQQMAESNLIHVIYNIDTLDWLAQSPDMIVKRAKAMMKKTPRDSGILLFHDTNLRSVKASADLMDHLKQDGRRVCTIGEIVSQLNEGTETVCPKF